MLILLLAALFKTSNAQAPALLRCKDNYMHDMQSLLMEDSGEVGEWSLNLVTPLQSLFYNSKKANIYKRLERACVAHSNFVGCLQTCPQSKARSIVEIGQTNWAFICYNLRHNNEFHSTILPCWIKHGEQISSQCHFHALMIQKSIVDLMRVGWNNEPDMFVEEICRTQSLYDKCYISNDKMCGKSGWDFLLKLNTKNAQAMIKLLSESIDVKTLPSVCDQWRYPEEYANWHTKKIAEAHRSHSNKLPTFLSFIISLIWIQID
ncbi:hypothetical protein M3Y97_00227800 [Aphelenchoides bicaudatus]|nr:hypothetical protein M3Y97_00227800 [Aphelenchoides bicaudatus]